MSHPDVHIQLSSTTIKYLLIGMSVLTGIVMVSQAEATTQLLGHSLTGFITVIVAALQMIIQGILARSVGRSMDRVSESVEAAEAATARASNIAFQVTHGNAPEVPRKRLPPVP
jgi:hypothetical protein